MRPAASIAVPVLLVVLVFGCRPAPTPSPSVEPDNKRIVVHTAAAMRLPVEKAAAEFERDTGIAVQLQFGASEGLLTTLKLTREGDLFLPADDSYVAEARKLDLVGPEIRIAKLKGVAVFRPGHPKPTDALTWDDFFAPGFRIAQPIPEATAIGRKTRLGLADSGHWARIEAMKPASVGSVTEAANAVNLGSADGAIIWDAVAKQYPKLKVASFPELGRVWADVSVAVCTHATNPTEAKWFAEYLNDAGRHHLVDAGYEVPGP